MNSFVPKHGHGYDFAKGYGEGSSSALGVGFFDMESFKWDKGYGNWIRAVKQRRTAVYGRSRIIVPVPL